MSSDAAIERVATLDPAMLAPCDFSFGPSSGAYPFDIAFASRAPADRRMLAIARIDGRIAGYVACLRGVDGAEVRRLEIDRSHRGKGLGRRLLDEARIWASEQGLPALRLETLADNPAAGRFFGLCGFTLIREAGAQHWHRPLQG